MRRIIKYGEIQHFNEYRVSVEVWPFIDADKGFFVPYEISATRETAKKTFQDTCDLADKERFDRTYEGGDFDRSPVRVSMAGIPDSGVPFQIKAYDVTLKQD